MQGYQSSTVVYKGLAVLQCIAGSLSVTAAPSEPWWKSMPWAIALISIAGFAALMELVWYLFLRRGGRLHVLKGMINMRKGTRGPPTAGTVSIVVTDIERFSGAWRGSHASPCTLSPCTLSCVHRTWDLFLFLNDPGCPLLYLCSQS